MSPVHKPMHQSYFRLGEGRISGYVSCALGALSLLAVLCFHFPEYLTTPELRAKYDVSFLRGLLAFAMVASVAFGLVWKWRGDAAAFRLGAFMALSAAVALAFLKLPSGGEPQTGERRPGP
jgi:hypothetical protein